MLSKNKLLPSFYDEHTKTEPTKHYSSIILLTLYFFLIRHISPNLFVLLESYAFPCSPVSDTTFPAGPMTHSFSPHIHVELRVGVAVRLVQSPLCVCVEWMCPPALCRAWPAHSVVRGWKGGGSAWLLASRWTQILWLAYSKVCTLALKTIYYYN